MRKIPGSYLINPAILFGIMAFWAAGCGGSKDDSDKSAAGASTASSATSTESAKEAEPEEDKLKQEQIAVLEKMAEQYDKVTDRASKEKVQGSLRELERKYQELNEKFNALPEERREAALRRLKPKEDGAVERMRESKTKANKAAAAG